jgi:hypothetical protein
MQRALDEGKIVGRELVTAGFGGRADLIFSRQVSRLVARLRHASSSNVRSQVYTGKHLLRLSSSQFDPTATLARRSNPKFDRGCHACCV